MLSEQVLALIALCGGVCLFMLGVELLGEGLKQSAGPLLASVVRKLTRNPLRGAVAGMALSTLIHNGPTTVLVLGYVNAGILTFARAIPIIFGSNVGTTLSMQVVSFDIGTFSFLILSVGVLLRKLAGPRQLAGELALVLVGFGMMFVGLELAKEGFLPLQTSETVVWLKDLLNNHSVGSYLGLLLLSALITAVFQSSGLVVSLLFSLAALGVLEDFTPAIPLLIGSHVGSTSTALLAASGGSISMWRLALVQVLFNVFGAVLATLMLPFWEWAIPLTAEDTVRQVANFNTFKQTASVFLFLPFAPLFGKLAIFLTPQPKDAEDATSHLDPTLLPRPERAILAVLHELKRQAGLTRRMLALSLEGMVRRRFRVFHQVELLRDAVMTIQTETQRYISEIAERRLEPRQVLLIQRLALASHSIERVGESVAGLSKLFSEKMRRNVWFTEDYLRRFIHLCKDVNELMEVTINGIDPTGAVSSECAETASQLAERLHIEVAQMREQVKTDVTDRGADGTIALFYLRTLFTLERVIAYLQSLAQQEQEAEWKVRESRLLDVSALRSRAVQRMSERKRDSYDSLISELNIPKNNF
ncbi:MAG: Na/Pi symporter [Candidatus Sumerlaeia bacterium]|nr:Na/Pi symporter [Candidatus Sumerlaeia bacterium]